MPSQGTFCTRIIRALFWALLMFYAWLWFSTNHATGTCIHDGLDGDCLIVQSNLPLIA